MWFAMCEDLFKNVCISWFIIYCSPMGRLRFDPWLGIKILHAERCGQTHDTIILYDNTWWEGKKKKTMKDSKSMALFSLMIHLCSFFIMTIRFVISTWILWVVEKYWGTVSLRTIRKCWCYAECCHRSYRKFEKKKRWWGCCPSVTKWINTEDSSVGLWYWFHGASLICTILFVSLSFLITTHLGGRLKL